MGSDSAAKSPSRRVLMRQLSGQLARNQAILQGIGTLLLLILLASTVRFWPAAPLAWLWPNHARSLERVYGYESTVDGLADGLAGSEEVLSENERRAVAAAVERITTKSKSSVVVTSITNSGYLDFTANWLRSIAQQGHINKVLLFAEDLTSFNYVNSRWPGIAVHLEHSSLAQVNASAQAFGSKGFFEITERRPSFMKAILRLGVDVFYNDLDMVWLRDPFPSFENNDFDLWVMDDWAPPGYFTPGEEVVQMFWDERDSPNLCSCLIYMQPTDGSIRVLDRWTQLMQRVQWEPNVQDQPYFNKALHTTPGIRVGVVPQQHYPPGQLYFVDDEWRDNYGKTTRIVHNNWVIGHDVKLQRFQNVGLWLVPGEDMDELEKLEQGR